MTERNTDHRNTIFPGTAASHDRQYDTEWIEIFKDRIAEDLKQILQEDMDWTTSRPILERLNRLREIEKTRLSCDHIPATDEMRKAS